MQIKVADKDKKFNIRIYSEGCPGDCADISKMFNPNWFEMKIKDGRKIMVASATLRASFLATKKAKRDARVAKEDSLRARLSALREGGTLTGSEQDKLNLLILERFFKSP